jgi:hypothetical protein
LFFFLGSHPRWRIGVSATDTLSVLTIAVALVSRLQWLMGGPGLAGRF